MKGGSILTLIMMARLLSTLYLLPGKSIHSSDTRTFTIKLPLELVVIVLK